MRAWLSGALVASLVSGASATVRADDVPGATSPAYSAVARVEEWAYGDRLRERIVGSRKREERIQEVPGSLTSLPAQTLRRSNLRRIHQIQESTPNLVYNELGNTGRVSLRGIGQPQTILVSGDSGVGIYLDGIFVARNQDQLPLLFDVEGVEVLRGPQGTLFGTNSPGGAISVVSRKPELEYGADAQLRIGNLDTLESRVTLNLPLAAERAALRVSLASVTRDGYTKNVIDGKRGTDDKELSARAQLLLLPSDDTELLVSGYYSRKDRETPALKCTLIAGGAASDASRLFEAAGGKRACARDAARDEFDFASESTFSRDDLTQMGASVQATWDVAPALTIKSISGFRSTRPRFASDGDGTELPFFGFANDRGRSSARQFSQELQLLGEAFDNRLRYVAGVYGFREQATQEQFIRLGFLPTLGVAALIPGAVPGLDFSRLSPDTDLFSLGVTRNPERDRGLNRVNNLSYAAFGQGTYALTERLDLTLGLRFTQERKRVFTSRVIDGCEDGPDINPALLGACRALVGQSSALLGLVVPGFERSTRFSEFSPQASLTYRLNDQLSVYGSYATGFRNGGFDLAALLPEQTDPIDPEDITSYEVGLKSSWLDGRFLLKAAAFSTVQEDLRLAVNLLGTGQDGDDNAGDAVLRGGELEMVLLVTERLGVSASLGALRARYRDLRPEFAHLKGERLALAPNYTMSFGVDYRIPLGSLGTLGIRTSWSHRGSQQNDPSGTDETLANKYALLDGRLSLTLPDGKTEIAAYGTNLLDRRYFNNAAASPEFGTATRIFGPPRLYGLEIQRSF